MYRFSQNGQEPTIDTDTPEAIEPAIRSIKTGCYHADQIERDPLHNIIASTLSDVGIKRYDGTCDPDQPAHL